MACAAVGCGPVAAVRDPPAVPPAVVAAVLEAYAAEATKSMGKKGPACSPPWDW